MTATHILLALFVATALLSMLPSTQPAPHQQYIQFLHTYGKPILSGQELFYRMSIFMDNLKKIQKHNANQSNRWQMGINQFADLTTEEFMKIALGEKPSQTVPIIQQPVNAGFAGEIDWRNKGIVTAVKNQGQCGSCWAFAATAAHESYQVLNKGQPNTINLSEQQLVDCSTMAPYGNEGCNGGYCVRALEYIKDFGQTTTQQYSYVARNQQCVFPTGKYQPFGVAEGHGCSQIEQIIARAPLAVRVDASNWHLYKSGIFEDCAKALNHAVFLVGSSDSAWTIKNSWSTSWGENGYIRLAKGDTCGVCTGPSFPI